MYLRPCLDLNVEPEIERADTRPQSRASYNAAMATTEDRGALDATGAWREELYERAARAAG